MSKFFKKLILPSLILFGASQIAFAGISQDEENIALQQAGHVQVKAKSACKAKKPTAKKCVSKQKHGQTNKIAPKKANKAGTKSGSQQICLPPDCGV